MAGRNLFFHVLRPFKQADNRLGPRLSYFSQKPKFDFFFVFFPKSISKALELELGPGVPEIPDIDVTKVYKCWVLLVVALYKWENKCSLIAPISVIVVTIS